jgi:preprotein translocase subunit SecD
VLCLAVAAGCGKTHRSELVLKIAGHPSKQQRLETAAVLRRRIDLLGIHDAKIRLGPRITISTHRPLTVPQRRVLTKRGSFAIYDLEADLAPASTNGFRPLASTGLGRLIRTELQAEAGSGATVRKTVRSVLAHVTPARCRIPQGCPGAPAQQHSKTYWYLFQYYPHQAGDQIPEVTGRDLRPSGIRVDTRSNGTGSVVLLSFTAAGNRKFHQITETEAVRGQALADAAGRGRADDLATVTRFAQHFAIVLDGELLSTPYIDYKQNPDGIDPSGAGAEISNIQSPSEAKDLALVLRSGALRVRLVVVR